MKFVPVIVSVVAGAPATTLDGDSDLMIGTGLAEERIVNCWLALPPPGAGLVTVTVTGPAVANEVAGTITTSCVGVCDWIGSGVAPKLTVEAAMKFVPVIVSVVASEPATTLDGDSDVMIGTGLLEA
jgi:hypothetical protein